MKKIVIIIGVFIIIMPIILISYTSYLEMKKYEPKKEYKISEKSYGDPTEIIRTTLEEKVLISGQFVSNSVAFVDVKNNELDNVKTVIVVNSEVKKGDVLVYVNNKPIYSPINGIVSEIDVMRPNGYIKLSNLDNLLLECNMEDDRKLELNKVYNIDNNMKIKLVSVSNVMNGSIRKAYFQVEGGKFVFGQTASFLVPTGVVYNDVLSVKKSCVYQKEKDGPYFIRRVSKSGNVIGEVQVKVGITDNDMISLSGAEERWFCDPDYGKLMNASLEVTP